MNSALELHDSEIHQITIFEDQLHLEFSSAYIHRSTGRPGIDAGSGYIQEAQIIFSNAICSGLSNECSGPLSDGFIRVDLDEFYLIALPFNASGLICAEFVFSSGATLNVTAKAVTCSCLGEPTYVESFAG
jgi:hypothetical protein